MTESIIAAVSRFLTPEMVGKIGSATGLDRATAQKAVDASVPAILGGFADLASKPAGARQLASAIAEQPSGLLSTLATVMSGNKQLQENGGGMLASLLGSGALGTMVSGVSKFAGIEQGPARGLIGLLAPAVLGVLGREQHAAGMDAAGLARMLVGQKDQISAAMPPGLSSMLGTLGTRDGVSPSTSPSEARVYAGQQPGSTQYRPPASDVQSAGPSSSWAYWALPLLALAGLLWYLLPSGRSPDTAQTTSVSAPVRVLPAAGDKSLYLTKASSNWTSLGAYYNQDIYNRAGEKIGVVKDLLVDPDGKINAAVIGVGRFLGIGEKDIAVPLAAIQLERRENSRYLTLDVPNDALRTAPVFDPTGIRR